MTINYQVKYWRELDQLKIHVIYLEYYLESTIKIDRALKIILAISSSGSIAGWVIWTNYQFIWASIIAISQVINAIKGYLPYSKRLKSLFGITNDFGALFLAMETDWFNVSEGKYSNEEIHKIHMKFKETRRQIIQKHLGTSPLPNNDKLMQSSIEEAKLYFSNFYGSEE